MKGDKKAITKTELEGYELFKSSGCTMCHNGEKVGGSSFMKMGLVKPYKTTNTATGVQAISGKDQDRMTFKVPILRNVELTYPYFHDGAAQTLEQATRVMGDIQLGRRYTDEEVTKIVAFLKTLTGEQPKVGTRSCRRLRTPPRSLIRGLRRRLPSNRYPPYGISAPGAGLVRKCEIRKNRPRPGFL